MGKCTFCSHRLALGEKPACAALCPTGALDFAALPESQLSARIEGMPDTELVPSILIRPLEHRSTASKFESSAGGHAGAGYAERLTTGADSHEPRIELAGEWSLAAFTLLLAVLFGLLATAIGGSRQISPMLFATLSALAAGLSLAHLGRPARAWRALLGIRRSPVSREVLGFGLLAGLGTIALAPVPASFAAISGSLGVAAGLFALVSADRVYRPVFQTGNPVLHSGGVLVTGLYLAALAAGFAGLAVLVGGYKLIRYIGRTWKQGRQAPGVRTGGVQRLVRVGLGIVVPAAAWIAGGTPLPIWALLCAVLGEAVDRAEFYSELEIDSPARQMRLDLVARMAEVAESEHRRAPIPS
jgi:DMSO reductase anchor subunit